MNTGKVRELAAGARRAEVWSFGRFVLALLVAAAAFATVAAASSAQTNVLGFGGTTLTVGEASDASGVSRAAAANAPKALVCPAGQLPLLDVAVFPTTQTGGAATPESAVLARYPGVGSLSIYPMGAPELRAPVWIVAGNATFQAIPLQDGTWFASSARHVSCITPPNRRSR